MAFEIAALDEENHQLALKLDKFPGMCPVCKFHIDARFLGASLYSYEFRPLYVAFVCPVAMCRAIFVATYRVSTSRASNSFPVYLMDVKVLTHTAATPFPPSVSATSPQFAKIFEEARTADANGLKEIAGPGYRKALEYLVKDFLLNHQLKNDPDAKDQVLKLMLGACIERFVDDPRIKAIAKRAAWLGNDETHYYRRWTDKDLDDLKKLLSMTVSWIDLNVTSAEYEQSMPE